MTLSGTVEQFNIQMNDLKTSVKINGIAQKSCNALRLKYMYTHIKDHTLKYMYELCKVQLGFSSL